MKFMTILIVVGIILLPGCSSDGAFVTDPTNVTALQYESVVLDCELSFDTSVGPFWLKDNIVIGLRRQDLNNPSYRVEGTGSHYNLHISNITVANEGRYVCQVYEPSGVGEQQHYVTVHIPPSIQVIPEQSALDIKLGDSVTVSCIVTEGRPKPAITWTKMGAGDASVDIMMDSNLLKIEEAQKIDTGVYKCTGTNDAGSVEKEISVNVRYGPTVNVDRSFIHTAPGQSIELKCTFSASPEVTVTWKFNQTAISQGGNFEIVNQERTDVTTSILHVRNIKVEDLGDYTCIGLNDWGRTRDHIIVSGIPHNLTIVSDEESGFVNQYTLEWTVVSLPSIVEFRILLEQDNGSAIIKREETVSAKKSGSQGDNQFHHLIYVIRELEKNTTYRLKLRAYNEVGISEWTERFTFHTPAEGKVAEPTDGMDLPEPTKVSVGSRSSSGAGIIFLVLSAVYVWVVAQ